MKRKVGTRLLSLVLSAVFVLLLLPAVLVSAEAALTEADKTKVYTNVSEIPSGDFWEWNRVIKNYHLPTDDQWHQALIMFQCGIPTKGMEYPARKYYLSGNSVVSYHSDGSHQCTFFSNNKNFANDPNMTMQSRFFTRSDLKAFYIKFAGYDSEYEDEKMPRYYIQLADSQGNQKGEYIGVSDTSASGAFRYTRIVRDIRLASPTTFYVGGENNGVGDAFWGEVYMMESVDNALDYAFQDGHSPNSPGQLGIGTRSSTSYPWNSMAHMSVYMPTKHALNSYASFNVSAGETVEIANNAAIPKNCKITVANGGTLSISGKTYLEGVIENHGTVVLDNEALVIPASRYAGNGGTIICDGGNLVLAEQAILYIGPNAALTLKNQSTVQNLGGIVLEEGIRMENSTFYNREGGDLVMGSIVSGDLNNLVVKKSYITDSSGRKQGFVYPTVSKNGSYDEGSSTSRWAQLGTGARIVNDGRFEVNTILYVKDLDNWYSGKSRITGGPSYARAKNVFYNGADIFYDGIKEGMMDTRQGVYVTSWNMNPKRNDWYLNEFRTWVLDSNGLKNDRF